MVWIVSVALAGMSVGCADIDDRPARWGYIHSAIIKPNCTTSNCHSDLGARAGVQLETPEAAYLVLTGRVCDGNEPPGEPPRNFVVPGQPESSKLLYMLRGQEVRRMPPDTALPDVNIDLIERWILEGARCD